jgi:hypothetical protein
MNEPSETQAKTAIDQMDRLEKNYHSVLDFLRTHSDPNTPPDQAPDDKTG